MSLQNQLRDQFVRDSAREPRDTEDFELAEWLILNMGWCFKKFCMEKKRMYLVGKLQR